MVRSASASAMVWTEMISAMGALSSGFRSGGSCWGRGFGQLGALNLGLVEAAGDEGSCDCR
jgi:hypothetical protein